MPEQKQEQIKQRNQNQEHQGGGLFPFRVKKFLSEVASAGHAVLKEHQVKQQEHADRNSQAQARKPPIVAGTSSPKMKNPTTLRNNTPPAIVTESKPQQQLQQQKLPRTPPTTRRPVAVSPGKDESAVDFKAVIDQQPIMNFQYENDWEILSCCGDCDEKTSSCSGVFVSSGPKAGSVRSMSSLDQDSSSYHATLSVPFKIQRTNSSSTLDSQDNVLGPSGKGILGVDYVEHVCLPTDTLQGICISYKVSASQLRRANHFSGTLHSAPKKLLIPLSKQALRTGFIRVQDTDNKEYKFHKIQAEYPDISATEAKAYLELADWELKDALQSAKEDQEWENSAEGYDNEDGEYKVNNLKSGQIGIRVGFNGSIPTFNLTGTGHILSKSFISKKKESLDDDEGNSSTTKKKEKVVVHTRPPSIATKSVLAEDLYNAAPQHNSYGLELKPLPKRNPSTQN
jgi:LysM repeat protein